MGIVRSVPQTHINMHSENLAEINYVSASVCGWEYYLEDHFASYKVNQKVRAFYVLDGYGGPQIAELCLEILPELIEKNQLIKLKQYKAAVQSIFESLDDAIKKKITKIGQIRKKYGIPPPVDGTTNAGSSIIFALVTEDQIIIANIGECKSYVCYRTNLSKAVLISGNHTQSNSEDQSRVKHAGGFFINGKVNGMIPITRSIANFQFKNNQFLSTNQQLLVSTPSIFSLRKQDIKILIMGSSGLWERASDVLKEITEEDYEIGQLKIKVNKVLENLICDTPKNGLLGLKNMAITVVDFKM